MDVDIYVEEIVVSAEVGSGYDAIYDPKKLRLFVWEGDDIVGRDCENECPSSGPIFDCSADLSQVLKRNCENLDNDYCMEWKEDNFEIIEICGEDKKCNKAVGTCINVYHPLPPTPGYSKLTCEKKTITETGHVHKYDDECDDHEGGGTCQ